MMSLSEIEKYRSAYNAIVDVTRKLEQIQNDPNLTGYQRMFIRNYVGIREALDNKLEQLEKSSEGSL